MLPSIKADFLNNLQIPIIPAEEQLRIAEKYEKMEAEKKRLKAEMNKLLTEKDNLISDFEVQNYIDSVKNTLMGNRGGDKKPPYFYL